MSKNLSFSLTFCAAITFFAFAAQAQTRPRKTPVKRPTIKAKPAPLSTGAVRTLSGLTYFVTQKGTGRLPKVGETVVVHYTGTLTNGVKFDSSRDAGRPYAFPLGKGEVIKGWDEGIGKLRVGDQAILIVPPSLGYGRRGRGPIPPDATMIFIVELVEIKE